jgi:hypothetical protein
MGDGGVAARRAKTQQRQVSARLSTIVLGILDVVCAGNFISRSDFISRAVEWELERLVPGVSAAFTKQNR